MNVNKELKYVFTPSGQWLRLFGIWPDPHIPLNEFRRPNIRFIIAVCIIFFIISGPEIMNVLLSWGDMSLMVKNFVSATFSSMGACKLIITWYHGEKALRPLILSFITDWTTSTSDWERNTMSKIARNGRSLSFRCCVVTTIMVTLYFCFHLSRFFKNINQPHRNLVYPLEKIQKSPAYEIIYFIQLSAGLCTAFSNYTIDSFVSILVLQVCAQLINLRTTLNNLVCELVSKSISSSRFREGLAAIVVRHNHLIRNAKTIDGCYSSILFVYVLATTVLMCFIIFHLFTIITDNKEVPIFGTMYFLFYFFLVSTNMYAYCYSAEMLMTESTKMAYGVYECKWYDLPPKDAKELMVIVHRSRIPLRLTAGKFGIFSLEMFGIVLKTSIGYLSVLLTIKD